MIFKKTINEALVVNQASVAKVINLIKRFNFSIESIADEERQTHLQIRGNKLANSEEEFKEIVTSLADALDELNDRLNTPITYNFGWGKDLSITAGIDVYGEHISDELEEDRKKKHELPMNGIHPPKDYSKVKGGIVACSDKGNADAMAKFNAGNRAAGQNVGGAESSGGEAGGLAENLNDKDGWFKRLTSNLPDEDILSID